MQINSTSHAHGPHSLQGPYAARTAARIDPQVSGINDSLDISAAAEAVIQAAESDEIRADLVARVKSQIASGVYETPDKLDAAMERLLDDIA